MTPRFPRSAFAFVTLGTLALSAQVRSVTSLTPAPAQISVGTPTVVTFAASVAYNPSLIPGSVNLTEVRQDGQLISVIGQMFDNGTHDDVIAGDNVFTVSVAIVRTSPMHVWYRATAAYQGVLARALSPLAQILVNNAACSYSINPPGIGPSAAGAAGTVSVTAPRGMLLAPVVQRAVDCHHIGRIGFRHRVSRLQGGP